MKTTDIILLGAAAYVLIPMVAGATAKSAAESTGGTISTATQELSMLPADTLRNTYTTAEDIIAELKRSLTQPQEGKVSIMPVLPQSDWGSMLTDLRSFTLAPSIGGVKTRLYA